MYKIDPRLRGLPAAREQVISVHQSINQPHLAVPGKQAGLAQAFIVGLRGGSGLAVFVYLYLSEGPDAAVYVPERRNLSVDDFAREETEALAFVESMGFMMDNLNFRTLPVADQENLLKTLPVFQREPRPAGSPLQPQQKAEPAAAQNQSLGRLLVSF